VGRVTLDDKERAVLAALAAEPDDAALAAYYGPIAAAAGDHETAGVILRSLKRRKLVGGEGRGMHASFWIEPKGREALEA
jgi:hypothetical protein